MGLLTKAVVAADRLIRLGQSASRTPPTRNNNAPDTTTSNLPSVSAYRRVSLILQHISTHSYSDGPTPNGGQDTTGPTIRYKPHWIQPQPSVSSPIKVPVSNHDSTWLPPPSDPNKGILNLPPELLRQIILHLIYNPERPDAFVKRALLPLASTSKALRALSTEFLFWSMDLFEASFGLRYRVLPSNTILELFHTLIHPPVPSFIRSGARRLLIRDRDVKALRAPEGQNYLCCILNRMENVRSIHFDGQFYRPLPIHAPFEIEPDSRLHETLGNLTFLNCDPLSPIFPCFLAQGPWSNLTRIEYCDNSSHLYSLYPSPFACFESVMEPVFPHLSIFIFIQQPKEFNHILDFIKLHHASLDRLSILFGDLGNFNFNVAEKVTSDNALRDKNATRELLQRECMRALWKCLPSLKRLRLLDLDAGVTNANYAPRHMVRLPNLRGLNLRHGSSWYQLQSGYQKDGEVHPATAFFNHVPCPSIGFSNGSPGFNVYRSSKIQRAEAAQHWFELSKLPHARNFTFSDVMEGTHVWISLDGGGVHDVRVAEEQEKVVIAGFVGDWSFREDAEINHRFTSE